jgi:hypothetical protein
MKGITQREFNYINLVLGVVIFLCVFYIGYKLTNNSNNKLIQNKPLVESTLAVSLPSNSNTTTLTKDLMLISRSIKQQTIDLNLFSGGLRQAIKIGVNNNNLDNLTLAKQTISDQLNLVAQMESELAATRELTSSQLNLLKSNVGLVKLSLNSLNHALKTNNSGLVIKQLNSQLKMYDNTYLQIALVKVSDDQVISELLFQQLASRLKQAISHSQSQGVAVTDFNADLTTLMSDDLASLAISKSTESQLAVLSLNSLSNLKKDNSKLLTAKRDIQAAFNAAQTIVKGIVDS